MSRLIEKLDEGEHLQPSDDGYVVYWTQQGGYLTAEHLREIADELDRRNKNWHEQVMQDVGMPMPKIKPLVWVQVDDGGTTYGGGSAVASFTVYHSLLTGKWTCLYGAFDSLDEAKAACQQEYERRVRECLE